MPKSIAYLPSQSNQSRFFTVDRLPLDIWSADATMAHGTWLGGALNFGNGLKQFRRRLRAQVRGLMRSRMPVAMITGSVGKSTTSRMLARILECQGHVVGLTTTDGIYVGRQMIQSGDRAGYSGARTVLARPDVTAAVLETARGGLNRRGLYLGRCDVAALLNVQDEQIGMDGIETVADMARLKRKVTDAARRVVLGADDPSCRLLAEQYRPGRVTLFGFETQDDLVRRHIAGGHVAFVVEHEAGREWIVRRQGDARHLVVDAWQLPSSMNGALRHNIANAMAAAALADALGVPLAVIAEALLSLSNSAEDLPSRFNIFDQYPFRIVVDRANSPPATRALVAAVARIPVSGRRLCMVSCWGNRPGFNYERVAAAITPGFDIFICYEEPIFRRGRPPAKIVELLKAGLMNCGVAETRIHNAGSYEEGLRLAASLATADDLLLVLGAHVGDIKPVMDDVFGPVRLKDDAGRA
ncbi:hypothetical protein EOC94_21015 [Mesorhizobium sp. M6A.T.Ce.TU.016.01.1.1]|nr:hypothetical protein EOC94_21015 [Mesorhizobium sp. M6A.T.Ce.TU.016.01.1.1]